MKNIVQRDYQDEHRAIAPLKAADDSILVDTSELTFEQSVKKIIEVIEAKL